MRIGGGDVTEKILQGIPPRSGIRNSKERGMFRKLFLIVFLLSTQLSFMLYTFSFFFWYFMFLSFCFVLIGDMTEICVIIGGGGRDGKKL